MTWLLITIIIVLAIIVGALGYACYNLLKKLEIYEDWTNMFRSEINDVYKQMKLLDEKEMFSHDDDVGFAFSELVRIIKEFDEKIK